jgi:Caspase recruitment domain
MAEFSRANDFCGHCRLSKRKNRQGSSKMPVDSSDQRQTNNTANNPTNEDSSRGRHSETIESMRSNLTRCMNPDDGLLDELLAAGVITHQQDEVIRSQWTHSDRVDQLLTFVINMPDEKQEQFLVALDNNQQTHVSAYIRSKENLSSLDQDSRPLYLCKEFRIIEKNGQS